MPAANETMFSLYQALQLAALLPCLFVIGFLLYYAKASRTSVTPILYFLSLSCSFMLPLLSYVMDNPYYTKGVLLFGQSLQPALCFLLIVQLLTQRIPPFYHWFVLSLPVIGSSSIIYAGLITEADVCFLENVCTDTITIKTLYQLFATSFIFLLLMMQLSQKSESIAKSTTQKNRYWIVITLILLNLLLVGFDLSFLVGQLTMSEVETLQTIIRIGFIYLVLTSLFRIYDSGSQARQSMPKPIDPEIVRRLEVKMMKEMMYRDMGCNRKTIAEAVNVSEHLLSRIINQHFKKNISEYVNGYRVEEAKKRLREEDTSITVIAFEVGFSSIASFNRVFKEMVGHSPTEYRAGQAQVTA